MAVSIGLVMGQFRVVLALGIRGKDGVEFGICPVLRTSEIVRFPTLQVPNFHFFPILTLSAPNAAPLRGQIMRLPERLLEHALAEVVLSLLRVVQRGMGGR